MPAGASRWLADYDGHLTDDVADLYWSLNTVRLGFEAGASGTVKVRLGTFTPGSGSSRCRSTARTMATTDPTVDWYVGQGEQWIEVAAINVRGIEGPRSRASLRVGS
jgi:hypothetical protein